jgi:aquaporin Z
VNPDQSDEPSAAFASRAGSATPGVTWSRRIAAEMFGTFALVFVAVGADAMASLTGGEIGVAARAVAPALMVAALIYAIGDGSGAHFNPVVSLAFALKRLFPVSWLLPYWGAQLLGALGASLIVSAMFGAHLAAAVTTPHGISPATAVAIEATLTALLLVVILGTADRYRVVGHEAALAVGATIALCGLIALPVDGSSMNPARSFGPAVVSGHLDDLWIYVAGPLIGAVVAVAVTRVLHGATDRDPKAVEAATGDGAKDVVTPSPGPAVGADPVGVVSGRTPAPRVGNRPQNEPPTVA